MVKKELHGIGYHPTGVLVVVCTSCVVRTTNSVIINSITKK